MRKVIYYILTLIVLAYIVGTIPPLLEMTILGVENPKPEFKINNLYGLLVLLFLFPYNLAILVLIFLTYYFNEIIKKESFISYALAFFLTILFLLLFSFFVSLISKHQFSSVLGINNHFNFIYIGLSFISSCLLFSLVMIPVHSYFRKRLSYLEDAE